MGKQKSDRIKKAMAILLVVFFVMSATAAAVSARPNHIRSYGTSGSYGGTSYGTGGGYLGDVITQVGVPISIATNVGIVTALNFGKDSLINVNFEQIAGSFIELGQNVG